MPNELTKTERQVVFDFADALTGAQSQAERDLGVMIQKLLRAQTAPPPTCALLALVNAQSEDEALWLPATSASGAYVQQELRRLHAAIEAAPTPPPTERLVGPDTATSFVRAVPTPPPTHVIPNDLDGQWEEHLSPPPTFALRYRWRRGGMGAFHHPSCPALQAWDMADACNCGASALRQ